MLSRSPCCRTTHLKCLMKRLHSLFLNIFCCRVMDGFLKICVGFQVFYFSHPTILWVSDWFPFWNSKSYFSIELVDSFVFFLPFFKVTFPLLHQSEWFGKGDDSCIIKYILTLEISVQSVMFLEFVYFLKCSLSLCLSSLWIKLFHMIWEHLLAQVWDGFSAIHLGLCWFLERNDIHSERVLVCKY